MPENFGKERQDKTLNSDYFELLIEKFEVFFFIDENLYIENIYFVLGDQTNSSGSKNDVWQYSEDKIFGLSLIRISKAEVYFSKLSTKIAQNIVKDIKIIKNYSI